MKKILSLLLTLSLLIALNHSCKKPEKVEPATISGVVMDKSTSEPIENVNVVLKPVGKTVNTNSEGYFEFGGLESGEYSLLASKTGYRDYIDNQSISVKSSATINYDILMERLSTSLTIVDDEGNEISELNFGNNNDGETRAFNVFNNGEMNVNFRIEKLGSWIVQVNETEGSLNPDSLIRVEVMIDREKLSIGENEASLHIISDEVEIELPVKAAEIVSESAYKSVNITTMDAVDVTTNSATLRGNISLEGRSIAEKGFVFYIDENSTVNYKVIGNNLGEYSYQVSELEDGTTYSYKAYMIVGEEIIYGEEKSFTTIEEIVITLPEVVTVSVMDVTENTAILTGEVASDGGAEVTERGFIWSENYDGNAIVDGYKVEVGSGLGVFTYELTDLQPNTNYYVLAYAINSEGEATGQQISFVTLEQKELINGYEYVDLGLPSGLKWATHNIGANVAEEYGEYYAWGEIDTKKEYTQFNSTTYGIPMDDFSGDPQYDVARAKWGSTWRMPTKEEQKELLDNCTWEWSSLNGVSGYLVTGVNGNSIFLPAAGYRENSSLSEVGQYGYYWSSTPQANTNLGAYYLYMSNGSKLSYYYARVAGQSVRAVSE